MVIRIPEFKNGLQTLKGAADTSLIAYIWLALELNYSILILGTPDANQFIDALGFFVPRYHTVLDLRKGCKSDLANFVSIVEQKESKIDRIKRISREFVDKSAESMKKEKIFSLMPNRILVNDEIRMGTLFGLPKFGISLIGSLKGNFKGKGIIGLLKSRPYHIKKNDMSALDISILLDTDQEGLCISGVTEYSWLERAEFRATDQTIVAKSFRNSRMACNRRANLDNINESKLLRDYAVMNLLDQKSAMEEIKRRAEFIKDIEGRQTTVPNPMILYNEIK
jgi:hypothetical protein